MTSDVVAEYEPDLNSLKEQLFDVARAMRGECGLSSNIATIVAVLGQSSCDQYVLARLQRKRTESKRFDPYWVHKHDDVNRRLIDRITIRFRDSGLTCPVASEEEGLAGRFDVDSQR